MIYDTQQTKLFRPLSIGSRSLLFGAHQVVIHAVFLFLAWWKLYGFPRDPRLYVAFLVHDLGYWGKPNIDGKEGEQHPELGANIMRRFFGDTWATFCLYHSRSRAAQDGQPFSKLCVADKLASALEPAWLFLWRVRLSGEIHEFMANSKTKYAFEQHTAEEWTALQNGTPAGWHKAKMGYLRRWAEAHRYQTRDTWHDTWKVHFPHAK